MCYKLIRPLLFCLSPERAHRFTFFMLKLLAFFGLSFLYRQRQPSRPVTLFGLNFPNPIGLAAGFDKNGDYIDVLAKLGFGYLEIGTVTPRPQKGNPKPRLFRLKKSSALINRMGFNNKGVDYLVKKLQQRKSHIIVGVNIGKNADTPMQEAVSDYVHCMEKVYPYADYITANISSPNTKNLRDLQSGESLHLLLQTLKDRQVALSQQHNRVVPLLVKVAPDLNEDEIAFLAQAFLAHNIDGVIATNTALFREGLVDDPRNHEKGGLSGQPILARSNQVLQLFKEHLRGQIPLIGVGGIHSAEDARKKLVAGADLLQLYTGLVYAGPGLIVKVAF